MSEANADQFSLPEFHRIEGALHLARSADAKAEAEACFQRAIEIARGNTARTLELRAATHLARLWGESNRRAEAHELLAPLYRWFAEGHDTPDLQDAKALLDELT